MNLSLLKQAEQKFLNQYPGGFQHPEMVAIGKKHRMEQMTELAKNAFSKNAFRNTEDIVSAMARIVSRSSMVSMFEKPKFKDFVRSLNYSEKDFLTDSLHELLHGKEKAGFESLVAQLQTQKIGKWTIATVFPSYYRPQKEVFIKPTTAKLIIEKLELDLRYHPTPTWDFYRDFRKCINELKTSVDNSLSPNNPAFCGFLMTSL
jgi:hypothetical protein